MHLPRVLIDLIETRESTDPAGPGAEAWVAHDDDGSGRTRSPRSLYAEILDFMFAPLALLWPLSVLLTFVVARSLADAPFDRVLEQRLRAFANHVELTGRLEMPRNLEPPLAPPASTAHGAEQTLWQISEAGSGRVLAGEADLPRPRVADLLPAEHQIRRRTQLHRGEDWRLAATLVQHGPPADGPLVLQLAETLERRNALANEIIRGIIVPQFLLLPIAVFLVWFGLSRGLHPLQAVQARIRKRRPDDFSPIDPRGTPEEITPLVTAFNDLLHRLEQNTGAQKRFIGDAAHQLKTPLAGLRTQAELALKEQDPAEVRRSLAYIAGSAERSARMVSQLLSLARMENLRDSALFAPIDLAALARETVADWVPQALARGIDLGFERDAGTVPIQGLPLLLRELLNNLIDNALAHTPRGGAVTVRVRRGATANAASGAAIMPGTQQARPAATATLEVEDTGCGIAPAEQGRIFDRFYRVLGSTSSGSGLGLAIVREIANQHLATVTVESPVTPAVTGAAAAQPGTRFTIRLPASTPCGNVDHDQARDAHRRAPDASRP